MDPETFSATFLNGGGTSCVFVGLISTSFLWLVEELVVFALGFCSDNCLGGGVSEPSTFDFDDSVCFGVDISDLSEFLTFIYNM